jgi:hypothetical protein
MVRERAGDQGLLFPIANQGDSPHLREVRRLHLNEFNERNSIHQTYQGDVVERFAPNLIERWV